MKLNIVPALTGLTWVKLGFRTFLRQPLAMSGLFFMFMAMFSIAALVPFVGIPLALALLPAASLGLMAATKEADKGNFPMPTVLLSAFRAGRQQIRAMLVLGAIYAVCALLISWLVPLVTSPLPVLPAAGPEAMTPEFQLAMMKNQLTAAVFFLPVSLMFWHAPALVHWHQVSPVKSLFFSFVACVRNVRAFLVFGFGWLVLILGLGLALSLVVVITGNVELAATIMMPLALMGAAMFSTSIYFTFRDSFTDTGLPATATPDTPATFPGDPT